MMMSDELVEMIIMMMQSGRENIDYYATLYQTTGFSHRIFEEVPTWLYVLLLKTVNTPTASSLVIEGAWKGGT